MNRDSRFSYCLFFVLSVCLSNPSPHLIIPLRSSLHHSQSPLSLSFPSLKPTRHPPRGALPPAGPGLAAVTAALPPPRARAPLAAIEARVEPGAAAQAAAAGRARVDAHVVAGVRGGVVVRRRQVAARQVAARQVAARQVVVPARAQLVAARRRSRVQRVVVALVVPDVVVAARCRVRDQRRRLRAAEAVVRTRVVCGAGAGVPVGGAGAVGGVGGVVGGVVDVHVGWVVGGGCVCGRHVCEVVIMCYVAKNRSIKVCECRRGGEKEKRGVFKFIRTRCGEGDDDTLPSWFLDVIRDPGTRLE